MLLSFMASGRPNVWPDSVPEGPRATWAESDPLNPRVFVPGGSFRSGSDDHLEYAPEGSPFSKFDEAPSTWTVPDFWIQQHEVTNEEYSRFDSTHTYPAELARHPVVNVTVGQAMEYAHFLGGQIPNEALWEYAARGTEARQYPWGDESPDCSRAQYVDCDIEGTVEVGSLPAGWTPLGIDGLAGNVREWVTPVWYDPTIHPLSRNVIRLKGGSFAHPAFFLRSASVTRRFLPSYSWDNVGFRVVWRADADNSGLRATTER